MWKCKICDKEFINRRSYAGHISSHYRGESYRNNRKKEKIQKIYECKFCGKVFETGLQLGGHQTHCKLNPKCLETKEKIKNSSIGRRMNDDTKKQMSNSRKNYLKNNPDKHPWKRNNKFKSEPCETFKDILRKHNFIFEEEFNPISNRFFAVDVAFPKHKICIEINGEQHYNRDGSLRKYYKDRHDIIKNAGWKIIEIHYANVYNETFINEIIKMLP